MAKIFGNTLTTPMNPDKLKNENGTGGGITGQEVEKMIRMFADTVVSVKADKHDVYTKEEINERIGDMENALDYIIMLQERYYNGESGMGGSWPGGDA